MKTLFTTIIRYLYNNFYDKTFHENKLKYIFQCSLAMLSLFFALISINLLANVLIIASIGSTAFVVFAMPNRERSRMRYVIGGYIVGTSVGCLCYYFAQGMAAEFPVFLPYFDEIFGAFAVGWSIFLMVILDLEHPPAASISLAMILNPWNAWTIIFTFIVLFLILSCRHLLRNVLIDLV